jgi:hypothetical protein
MYSIAVAAGAAPSHVGRQDVSSARHVCVTHTAIETQFGSFGQLEAPQQLEETHDTHAGAAVPKISVAPVQLPPSLTSVALSEAPASLTGVPPPPAVVVLPHVMSCVGTQAPSSGG